MLLSKRTRLHSKTAHKVNVAERKIMILVLDSCDIFMELLCYVSARDWSTMNLLSRECHRITGDACSYMLKSWTANPEFCIPQLLHQFLNSRKYIELFVILSLDSHRYATILDESHRTLLDLSVDSHMYGFAEWLLGKGFKSNTDAETMFNCIRSHDIRGATVLLNCGIPVDRFRSRDDGLNVLTCSVMYGSPALVDMFILRGCSYVDLFTCKSQYMYFIGFLTVYSFKQYCRDILTTTLLILYLYFSTRRGVIPTVDL